MPASGRIPTHPSAAHPRALVGRVAAVIWELKRVAEEAASYSVTSTLWVFLASHKYPVTACPSIEQRGGGG